MPSYTIIGYSPDALVFGGGGISLDPAYDHTTDRRSFEINDASGGFTAGGFFGAREDEGLRFDGDRYVDEAGDDFTQTGSVKSIDGSTTFDSGRIYLEEAYQLDKPGVGTIDVYRVEVDGDFVGYVTSEPLLPGINYTFSTSNVVPFNAPEYSDFSDVPCFVEGTVISSIDGEIPIENLNVGDAVFNTSGEYQTIRWIGKRQLTLGFCNANQLQPICIKQGAFGNDLPNQDLYVSPNHRMVVSNAYCELLFGESETLVPAKFLLDMKGVTQDTDLSSVTYYHLLFDSHQTIYSNGCPSESLHPGDVALDAMGEIAREEVFKIFPKLKTHKADTYGPTAARVLKRYEAEILNSYISDFQS